MVAIVSMCSCLCHCTFMYKQLKSNQAKKVWLNGYLFLTHMLTCIIFLYMQDIACVLKYRKELETHNGSVMEYQVTKLQDENCVNRT